MTRFEEMGVHLQNQTYTLDGSKAQFERSCDLCVRRGMCIDCDQCGIRTAFEINQEAIKSAMEYSMSLALK